MDEIINSPYAVFILCHTLAPGEIIEKIREEKLSELS
jgi:hypothetical protein